MQPPEMTDSGPLAGGPESEVKSLSANSNSGLLTNEESSASKHLSG